MGKGKTAQRAAIDRRALAHMAKKATSKEIRIAQYTTTRL
jgi:hypothetical protein